MVLKRTMHNPKVLFIYICLLIGILGMEAGGLQYNLLLIAEELGLTTTQMGNLASAQYIAFIIIPLVFGGLGDRFGKKLVMISFGLCFSCGCLAVMISNGFLLVAAGIFLMGAGYSMCESTGTSLLSDMFHEDSSRYINWSQSWFSAGALLSPLLSQFLVDAVGLSWRIFFSILMVLYVVLAFWAMRLKFPQGEEKQIVSDKERIHNKKKERMPSSVKIRVGCLAAAITIYAGMESGIAYFIGMHVSSVLGTEAYNSLGLSLFWLMMIPSRYFAGLIKKSPRKMLILSYFGSAIAIALVIMMTTRNGLLIVYAVMGFFFGPAWPLIMGEAGNLDSDNSARISGIMIAFCGLGGVLAPTLFGVFADAFSLTVSLLFVMGITVAGLVIALVYDVLSRRESIDR